MTAFPQVFSFDSNLLLKNGVETCFEMNKADLFAKSFNEKQQPDDCVMFWKFGEDTCPEFQMAIRKAKLEHGHLWFSKCQDQNIADLIFQNLALKKANQALAEENVCLRDEISRLVSQLKTGFDKSDDATLGQLVASVPEVNMSTMYEETTSTFYNPVPGINTILSCTEGKAASDTRPTTTLTVNVLEKIDKIRQMFYDGDSEIQKTLSMDTSTLETTSTPIAPKSFVPLFIYKDAPADTPHGHDLGGPQYRSIEPSAQSTQPKKPPGLQIFKNPDGLELHGTEPMRPRQPLRTITHPSPPQRPPPPSVGNENLGVRLVAREPLQLKSVAAEAPTFTLPIVFDPPCASTAVFTRRLFSPPPPSASLNSNSKAQKEQPQWQPQEEMEMESLPSPPSRPNSPLTNAFNHHVYSPKPDGRLRIDATNFIDAFLSKRVAKTRGSEKK